MEKQHQGSQSTPPRSHTGYRARSGQSDEIQLSTAAGAQRDSKKKIIISSSHEQERCRRANVVDSFR